MKFHTSVVDSIRTEEIVKVRMDWGGSQKAEYAAYFSYTIIQISRCKNMLEMS